MGKDWNRADLKDRKFGKLTVYLLTDRRIGGHAVWQCRCECGGWADVTSANLKSGNTLSCGCEQVARTLAHLGKSGPILEVDSAAIKAAKIASGLTYEDLAEECEISDRRLSDIVCGRIRYVPRSELRRLAKALGISPKSVTVSVLGRPKKPAK